MKVYSLGQKVEQGTTFKIDEILNDKTEDLLQEVLPSVETGHDLEDTALEEAIGIDLNLGIETDFKEDLTPEDREIIMINRDHLEISPNVLDVIARTAR